ncbi:hypothetical protein K4Q31_12135 [Staphylococcus epidermidis]|nr:hypothetical protein [Staphylococcus epidermidis]MCG2085450.1 hypothetical protein [Staphylococcus epidermidis]MCG2254746.1 hypothetical protein [Staphylococcus epidermidis]
MLVIISSIDQMISGLSIFTLFFFTPILFKVGSILFLTFSFKLIEDQLNLSQYNYILIDTHPDFRTVTRNTVVVSDKKISLDVTEANNDETKGNMIERYTQCINEIIDFISKKKSYL